MWRPSSRRAAWCALRARARAPLARAPLQPSSSSISSFAFHPHSHTLNTHENTTSQVSPYVLRRLYLLKGADLGQDVRKRRAKLLAFLGAAIALHCGRNVLRADPGKGGLEGVARSLKLRPNALAPLLAAFFHEREEDGAAVYERDKPQRNLLLAHLLAAAVLAENGFLGAESFEALRAELKSTAADLVPRFRELGCVCNPTTVAAAGDDGEPTRVRAYTVALLKDTSLPAKTLADCFPKIKTGPKRK